MVCGRLWDRAVLHQHQHEQGLPPGHLRGSSDDQHADTTTANPIPQQHQHTKPRKPFFGPWHDDSGPSSNGGMGPLGTSGEFASFKVGR